MTDLNTMLRQQMVANLTATLDQATQAGDIQASRKAAQQLAEFSVAAAAAAPKPPKKPPTVDEIKIAIAKKADWFGIDPRRSAQIVELGKMMDPDRFENADAFADALLKEYEKDLRHGGPRDPEDEDDSGNEEESDDETGEDDDNDEGRTMRTQRREARPARRNGSVQPELNAGSRSTGNNMRRAFETGDIKNLPRTAADSIRKAADRMANKATKEQRAAFIQNAVKAHARSELIATGKYDARDNKFK